MKVVLVQDVKGLGAKGTEVEQKDGYALNYLIPKGLAVPVNSGAAKNLMQHKAAAASEREVQHELLHETVQSLNGVVFAFTRKANEQGGLYDKIDAKEILQKIEEDKGVLLPKEVLALEQPIDSTGEHAVSLMHEDVTVEIRVKVEGE